eukprot:s3307_g4.t1
MLSSSSSSDSDTGEVAEHEVVQVDDKVKSEKEDEPPEHLTSSSWRQGPVRARKASGDSDGGEAWVPTRVTEALERSPDFATFKKNRTFVYVHLFAGAEDVLGKAIKRLADLEGLQVEIWSYDRDGNGADLTAEQPFGDLLDSARGGLVDGGHSGFPCGSFSRARLNEGTGPPPVRSLEMIYGLMGNSPRQQEEADRGTLCAVRSVQFMAELLQTQRLRRVPECGTLENPPGSEGQQEGPAWKLPEVEYFLGDFKCDVAKYNTCAFQLTQRVRWYKPGQLAGKLDGLKSLARTCTCPKYYQHEKLVGKELTSKAAKYPDHLALELARLIVKCFRTTLELEFWRFKERKSKEALGDAREQWVKSKEKQHSKPVDSQHMKTIRGLKRAWQAGDVDKEQIPTQAKMTKRQRRDEENFMCVGGMRNPSMSLARMNALKEAGGDVARLWLNFEKDFPQVLDTARAYGSDRCEIDEEALKEWNLRLGAMLTVQKPSEVQLKGRFNFTSPLKANFWDAWQKFSKDPEVDLSNWIKFGAPLGMSEEIPRSRGIFPPVEDEEVGTELISLESQVNTRNYASVYEGEEAALGELQRLIERDFAMVISADEAQAKFEKGTVSRLALISKQKESGVMKHRLIIDLLRSGGNSLAKVPERIVLPRIQDAVRGIQRLWRDHHQGQGEGEPLKLEIIGADLRDAYCHLGVADGELKHCLSPSIGPGAAEGELVLFKAMLFGFRGAPLIMGRLAAALTRQWQAVMQDKAMLQTYMDDPLMVVIGNQRTRDSLVARFLYMAASFGVNLAYDKGERGTRVCWIGVTLEIDQEGEQIIVNAPPKLIKEVMDKMTAWKGMVGMRELRAVTGKLSWVAGILPRARWAVAMFYGALAECEREERLGLEEERARKRDKDQRPKLGLVPVKRLELGRRWLLGFLGQEEIWRSRRIPLTPKSPAFAITTDASPFGVGAILSAVDKESDQLTPMVAFRGKVSRNIAHTLGIEFRQASGQAVLESWTVLLAVKYWKATLKGQGLLLKADSTVALALSKKLASSTPVLNWVGAELSTQLEVGHMGEIVGHHLPGKLNTEADWLSRPDLEGTPPGALQGLSIRSLNEAWMIDSFLPPPGVEPGFWGRTPPASAVFDFM